MATDSNAEGTPAADESETAGQQQQQPQRGSGNSRMASQMTKLRDANTKYKSLLKMAKERIQTQEDELVALRGVYSFVQCL